MTAPWWVLGPHVFGFLFSLVIGSMMIRATWRELWRNLGRETLPWGWHTQVLGVLERALYTSAWLVGQPAFIVAWLAFKAAGQWKRWGEDEGGIPGRVQYNIFLVCSGLSVAYGVLGGLMIDWCRDGNIYHAATAPVALLILNLYILYKIQTAPREEKPS
ncbi:MAG: hypothetical protein N2512_05585 [Armatimonadetes bacterium]|nr:hypothetical protein [Armatimonadota bacterium]